MTRYDHDRHWSPREKLKNELAKTEDGEFTFVFYNGEEVDIEDVPNRAVHSATVTAYSDNYEFVTQERSGSNAAPRVVSRGHQYEDAESIPRMDTEQRLPYR